MTLPSLTYRLPLALLAVVMFTVASAFGVSAQQTSGGFVTPGFTPPATVISSQPLVSAADSVMMPWPVANAIPQSYEDLMQAEYAADLASPSALSAYMLGFNAGSGETPPAAMDIEINGLQVESAFAPAAEAGVKTMVRRRYITEVGPDGALTVKFTPAGGTTSLSADKLRKL